jgi:hypothetical protein
MATVGKLTLSRIKKKRTEKVDKRNSKYYIFGSMAQQF